MRSEPAYQGHPERDAASGTGDGGGKHHEDLGDQDDDVVKQSADHRGGEPARWPARQAAHSSHDVAGGAAVGRGIVNPEEHDAHEIQPHHLG